MANFHGGDSATVWGITAADFAVQWADGQGAAGFTGLTLHATNQRTPQRRLRLLVFQLRIWPAVGFPLFLEQMPPAEAQIYIYTRTREPFLNCPDETCLLNVNPAHRGRLRVCGCDGNPAATRLSPRRPPTPRPGKPE